MFALGPAVLKALRNAVDFFKEDVFADMIRRKSGYQDTDEILMMIKVMKEMNKSAEGHRATGRRSTLPLS